MDMLIQLVNVHQTVPVSVRLATADAVNQMLGEKAELVAFLFHRNLNAGRGGHDEGALPAGHELKLVVRAAVAAVKDENFPARQGLLKENLEPFRRDGGGAKCPQLGVRHRKAQPARRIQLAVAGEIDQHQIVLARLSQHGLNPLQHLMTGRVLEVKGLGELPEIRRAQHLVERINVVLRAAQRGQAWLFRVSAAGDENCVAVAGHVIHAAGAKNFSPLVL